LFEHGTAFGVRVDGPDLKAVRRIAGYLDDIVLEVAADP